MKAIVYNNYGSPDVPRLEDIQAERVNENETPLCINLAHSVTVAGRSILDRLVKVKPFG